MNLEDLKIVETVKVGTEDITIDPNDLDFNEATLNDYMQKEASLYNYYGQKAADAQAQLQLAKMHYEVAYAEKFQAYKASNTVALTESLAKADPEVVKASKHVIACTRVLDKIKNYLRSWDKNHDNAQALGHMIRKEMDKLGLEIKAATGSVNPQDALIEDKIKAVLERTNG